MPSTYPRAVPESELISRADAADRLGVSRETIDRYARTGRLTRHRNTVTRRVRFDIREVDELRREREGEK